MERVLNDGKTLNVNDYVLLRYGGEHGDINIIGKVINPNGGVYNRGIINYLLVFKLDNDRFTKHIIDRNIVIRPNFKVFKLTEEEVMEHIVLELI